MMDQAYQHDYKAYLIDQRQYMLYTATAHAPHSANTYPTC